MVYLPLLVLALASNPEQWSLEDCFPIGPVDGSASSVAYDETSSASPNSQFRSCELFSQPYSNHFVNGNDSVTDKH